MNKFEGMNLADLMAQLHTIVLPEQISYLPSTIGWKILGIWLLAVVLCVVTNRIIQYQRDRYRREALLLLQDIEDNVEIEQQGSALATVIKQTVLAAYGRDQASLYGEKLASFLVDTSNGNAGVAENADLIARVAYNPHLDPKPLFEPARFWVTNHRV